MQRIKIEEPASYPFSTNIRIRITDLNYGNHVGNDAFLSLVHEARVQFLESKGYSELNTEGFGLIMADAAIQFKNELHYGDTVTIEVAAFGFSKMGFDLVYRLTKLKDGKPMIVGIAKTAMVLYNYTERRPVMLTNSIRQQLES
jgi:acyl-CoA thioesterase FadM